MVSIPVSAMSYRQGVLLLSSNDAPFEQLHVMPQHFADAEGIELNQPERLEVDMTDGMSDS